MYIWQDWWCVVSKTIAIKKNLVKICCADIRSRWHFFNPIWWFFIRLILIKKIISFKNDFSYFILLILGSLFTWYMRFDVNMRFKLNSNKPFHWCWVSHLLYFGKPLGCRGKGAPAKHFWKAGSKNGFTWIGCWYTEIRWIL